MALVVEDGSGKADAEANNSVAEYKAFAAKRGWTTIAARSDADCEADLREAFQYINTIRRYKGLELVDGQAGAFPRSGLTNWSGRTVTGLPPKVKQAECELAYRVSLGETLYEDLDRGGKITSESVGPISVSYAYDAPIGKTFRSAMALLQEYIRDPRQAFAPVMGGAAGQASTVAEPTELTPAFSIGMMTNDDG